MEHHKAGRNPSRRETHLRCIQSIVMILSVLLPSEAWARSASILDNCDTSQSSNNDVSLSCRLRTINSEFDRTNLSGLPGDIVTSLRLDCSDVLFYQSALEKSTLSHLTRLTSLHIEHCKLSRLPPSVFSSLTDLKNLTIRTHNTAWPALSLDIAPGVFGGLSRLEKIDLSSNNIWTFPENSFCGNAGLREINLGQNRLQDLNVLSFNERKEKGSGGGGGIKRGNGGSGGCGAGGSLGIEVLNVSYNRLILLPPSGLSKLTLLRELYLEGNEISIVSGGAFTSLGLLKILNLGDNKIEQLPGDVFGKNNEISEIYLQNNSLSSLAPGIFANLDQLVVLDLSRNKLSSEKIVSGGSGNNDGTSSGESPFQGLIRLVNLNLSHNRLTSLRAQLFHDLFSLQVLNLEHNEISEIGANTFMALTNLHTLTLSNNKITYIDSTTLNGLFVLTFLSLDNNQIGDIHPQAFHNNSNVRDINLNGNSFSSIPAAIQNLTFLKTLDLGENGISDLGSGGLIGLPNLYGLRFTGNQITNVSAKIFKELPSLKVVNLARNQIHSVEAGAFDSNPNLQAVRLDANYLTDINGLFASLPSLLWLNVSDNRLTWFDYALIPGQLMWLDLHKNSISGLENVYGRQEFRLQTLDASYNLLTAISGNIIPDSLENLYLNDNLIRSIEPNTFYKKVNLSRVDLFMNQIESLELAAFQLSPLPPDGSKSLPEFYLSGNPLICDCRLEWITRINKLSSLGQYPVLVDLDNMYCQLPYHQVQKKELAEGGRSYTEGAGIVVPHYFHVEATDKGGEDGGSPQQIPTPIVLPINQVASDQFLCPYTTHCFNNCHCCDFEACDCQMTCPTGCQCYHDNSWTVNIVDCSAGGSGGSGVSSIPLPPSLLDSDREIDADLFAGGNAGAVGEIGGIPSPGENEEARKSRRKSIPTSIPMDSTEIHLDGNQLDFLPSHVFIGRKNLERLYLNDSRIDTIMNNSFSGLRRLSVLHLEDNFLRELRGYEFEPLENLRELYLHRNQISFIGANAFVHLKNLEILTLSGNQISRFSVWSLTFLPYLRQVGLEENPWSCDCEFLVQALPWIQSNLEKLSSVEEMNGSNDSNESAEPNESRQRFRGGYGSSGLMEGINPGGTAGWSGRPRRNINLNCVQEETGKSWPLLKLNASYCSGENSILVAGAEVGFGGGFSSAGVNDGLEEANIGKGSRGVGEEEDVNNSGNENDIFPYLPSFLAIGAVLLFVSTVFFAVCRQRGSSPKSCFGSILGFGRPSLENCLPGGNGENGGGNCYDKAGEEDMDKLFDAYIAYSVKDEAWVSQILANNIQQQNLQHSDQPYRLCLHYRDFVMTAYIADTIVEAVESSRRTIVVLSKNFLQSEWCSYEFKSALHTAIRGGNMKNRLIIVTLGDISTRDLDPDLRVMLRHAIVLQASDKLFWSKLKNTLPEPRPATSSSTVNSGSTWRHYHANHKHVNSSSTTASYYDVNERNNWLQPGLFPQLHVGPPSLQGTCSSSASPHPYSPPPPPPPPLPHHHPVMTQQLPHHHHHHHSNCGSLRLNEHPHNLQPILDNFHNVQCNQMIMMMGGHAGPELDKTQYSYVETA